MSSQERQRLVGALVIDKHWLDTEVMEQPVLYHEVADQAAVCASYRDKAKKGLAETEAKVGASLRLKHKKAGDKLTEREVAEKVLHSEEYREAYKQFLRYKLLTDRWGALRESFDQRENMLRVLESLISANYYSGDSVSEGKTRGTADRVAVSRKRQQLKQRR